MVKEMHPPAKKKIKTEKPLDERKLLSNGIKNGDVSSTVGGSDNPFHHSNHSDALMPFDRPTQIYRFIATHSESGPVFLHRNISYMKGRMSRNHKSRQFFKVDSMLDRYRAEMDSKCVREDFIVRFVAFDDKKTSSSVISHPGKGPVVSVQADVVNIYNDGGVERSTLISSHKFSEVPLVSITGKMKENPKNVLNISHDRFTSVRTCSRNFQRSVLQLTVHMKQEIKQNQDIQPAQLSPDSNKKRRSRGSEVSSTSSTHQIATVTYTAVVPIFNEKLICQMTAGTYDIHVNPGPVIFSPKKEVWRQEESVPIIQTDLTSFEMGPMIRLKVSWVSPTGSENLKPPISVLNGSALTSIKTEGDINGTFNPKPFIESKIEDIRVTYRFVHNNTAQETVVRNKFSCPWCFLNCSSLKPLVYHLKNCHPRFHFRSRYEQIKGRMEAKIDVSINDAFDGSYAGNPHSWPHTGFGPRDGPTRRTPYTVILVSRRGQKKIMDPTTDVDDDELEFTRPLVIGHDRLYYHTNTCIPIRPQDMDIDSEEENDPQWMRQKTQQVG